MPDIVSAISQSFDEYMSAYFGERDIPKTLAKLGPQLTGFGTGIDEIDLGNGLFRALYTRDLQQAPGTINYTYHQKIVLPLGPETGLVAALFDIAGEIEGEPFVLEKARMSLVFQLVEGQWLIAHKHISLPTVEHEEGEAYPLKELQERNRILEERVAAKTAELQSQNRRLQESLEKVKRLSGMLPICAGCKKIRDDNGYWEDVAVYIRDHSEAEFSHGLCPDCLTIYFPGTTAAKRDRSKDKP